MNPDVSTATEPWKIGFHLGPGGNPTGIGDFMRLMLEYKRAPFIKSADHYGPLYELDSLRKEYGHDATGVFRLTTHGSGKKWGYEFDVPNYAADPNYAANVHLHRTIQALPPEFDPYNWLELCNEVDKERSTWLGQWALYSAEEAIRQGLRTAYFGWSSGEPEPYHWELPSMLAFLRFAAKNRSMVAVALHEYSYHAETLDAHFPWHIGRFTKLFEVCDKHGIPHPTVLITEFGWTYQANPAPSLAIPQMVWANGLYAPYPTVEGAGTWYLGDGFGDIADDTQKLIAPVGARAQEYAEYTPNFIGQIIGPPQPPIEVPPQPDDDNYVAVINLLPQDATVEEQEKVLRDPERVESKQGLLQSAHDAVRLVTAGLPGSQVRVWEPDRWGDSIEEWLRARNVQDITFHYFDGQWPELPDIKYIVNDLPKHPTKHYSIRPLENIKIFVIHHSVTPITTKPEVMAQYHVNTNGWPGIGYHFLVYYDGTIYQTNDVEAVSYHAYTVNPSTIGICLVGDFTHNGPPNAQLQATKKLCQYLDAMLPNDIGYYAHRQVVQTACPGNTWQSWFPAISGQSVPSPTPQPPSQPPATGNARLGLHARGDGGDFPEADFNEFKAARADAIKVMTIHGDRSVARLAAQHPGAPFVIRIYQSWGGRNVTPRQFFDWNAPDLDRTIKAIGPGRQVLVELHNEPNLTHEGLGHSWANGAQFNDWLLEALGYYRQAFPNVDYIFPGLSPGGDVPGIHENDLIFIDRCREAVAACDALGVHAYWNTLPDTPYPMPAALDVVDWYIAQFPTKPVWVTEASNNKAETPANKGQQYVQFWQELRKRPTVQAVTYFICSASDPNFAEEVWAGRGIGATVGQRIREDLVGRREVTYEYPG